jgi:glycosyltransferase involved in cell wall biosynthesis
VKQAKREISLIVATLGRISEPEALLASILAQDFPNIEMIIVDQNLDDRLDSTIRRYSNDLRIVHVRSATGLSRSRNVGLSHCEGEVIAFPDDDCTYPPALLRHVHELLEANPRFDGVSGRVADPEGSPYARFDPGAGMITLSNAWQRASAISVFIRREVVRAIDGFDESLGLGAGTQWGGAEDIDLVIRAVGRGFKIQYVPTICVWHPNPLRTGYGMASERAYRYGTGIGRVWRKHSFPPWLVAYYLLRPLGGMLIALARADRDMARYHYRAFRGRLQGWLAPLDK